MLRTSVGTIAQTSRTRAASASLGPTDKIRKSALVPEDARVDT